MFRVDLFQEEVLKYLHETICLGDEQHVEKTSSDLVQSLLKPPTISSIRVNTLSFQGSSHDDIMEQARKKLSTIFNDKYEVKRDEFVNDCLTIPVEELHPSYESIPDCKLNGD